MPDLPEGFVRHDGGPCPVPLGSVVTCIFADGDEITDNEAIFQEAWWRHRGAPENNIIAYKPES